jgi:hypothetical protein
MADKIPAIVVALAAQVGKNPIAWSVHPKTVVIVFQDGPKLTFDREASPRDRLPSDIVPEGAQGLRPHIVPAKYPQGEGENPAPHPSPTDPTPPPPHRRISRGGVKL